MMERFIAKHAVKKKGQLWLSYHAIEESGYRPMP